MSVLEQITLNGAMTILSYLQYSQANLEQVNAEGLVATLCEMLTQVENTYPGITEEYGWVQSQRPIAKQPIEIKRYLEADRV